MTRQVDSFSNLRSDIVLSPVCVLMITLSVPEVCVPNHREAVQWLTLNATFPLIKDEPAINRQVSVGLGS